MGRESATRGPNPAQWRQIELHIDLQDNLPSIETDAGKLQQILYNFVSNALKFTPAGGRVTLQAERITDITRTVGVRLSVADTGQGVPHDLQEVIFEKFRQADASHTRQHEGVGLGLAFALRVAEAHGGTVRMESPPAREIAGHRPKGTVAIVMVARAAPSEA